MFFIMIHCRQVWLKQCTDHQLCVFCCVLISINFNQTLPTCRWFVPIVMKNILWKRFISLYVYFVVQSCIKNTSLPFNLSTIITLFCRNNDYTEYNTCNPRHVVTDQYDILNTTNMGKYLWIVIYKHSFDDNIIW